MTPTIDLAILTAQLGLAALRLQRKAPPLADPDPTRREGPAPGAPPLPTGRPIAERLREFFKQQEREILAAIPKVETAPIPDDLTVTDWTGPMTAAMTPVITPYWEESGQRTMAGLGLDPKTWEVTNPHIRDKIREQSFHFCDSTNETTSLKLEDAHAELRKQLEEGIVDRGETLVKLRKRVQSIFAEATDSRAHRIANTEASRAVHAAQQEGAKQSGIVSHKSLLISSDACPLCRRIKASEPDGGWPLDGEMANIGSNQTYSSIPYPPLHPGCACSMTLVVDEAALAAGPELPEGVTPEEPSHPDPSRAAIDGEPDLARIREVVGDSATARDVASLIGAPDNTTVSIRADEDGVHADFYNDDVVASRSIYRDADGTLWMHNNSIYVEDKGRGSGAAIFGRQVANAAAAGVDRIETFAAGEPGSKQVGYAVWPKFGYDRPLRPSDTPRPEALSGAETVGDLMKSEEGRAWWAENGKPGAMTFDLTPGSQSRRVWDAYRAEKAKMAKAKGRSK